MASTRRARKSQSIIHMNTVEVPRSTVLVIERTYRQSIGNPSSIISKHVIMVVVDAENKQYMIELVGIDWIDPFINCKQK